MSVPEVEKTYLQLDAVVLTGVTAEYTSQNATSKEYVDTSITLAVNGLLNGAGPAYDTLKELGDAITNSGNTLSVEILNKVATEKTDRESAITELKTYVDNGAIYESNARINEDLSLSQRINDEIVNRESVVWQVGNTLSSIDSALNSR